MIKKDQVVPDATLVVVNTGKCRTLIGLPGDNEKENGSDNGNRK